jgi:hypothetical protein
LAIAHFLHNLIKLFSCYFDPLYMSYFIIIVFRSYFISSSLVFIFIVCCSNLKIYYSYLFYFSFFNIFLNVSENFLYWDIFNEANKFIRNPTPSFKYECPPELFK